MTLATVEQPDSCPTCGHALEPAADFRYDADSHVIIAGGRARHFQAIPWNVLEMLIRRFGHTVDFDSLITAAWGLDEPDNPRKYLNGIIFRLNSWLAGTGLTIICYRDAGYVLVHAKPVIAPTCAEAPADKAEAA